MPSVRSPNPVSTAVSIPPVAIIGKIENGQGKIENGQTVNPRRPASKAEHGPGVDALMVTVGVLVGGVPAG
jgi:hypothetical protein